MSTIVNKSINAIEQHMKNERQAFFGLFQGECPGGFCRIHTANRHYFVHYILDEKLERFFVDIYPQCVCEKPYLFMSHYYANKKNSSYKSGRIDIDDDCGEVRIRVETSIVEHSVEVKDIKDMEHLAIRIADEIERRFDRLGHGIYFEEDDPAVMGEMEKKMMALMKKMEGKSSADAASDSSDFDDIMDMLDFDDDSDENDGDNADDSTSAETTDDKAEESDDADSESATSSDKSFDDLFPKDDDDD